MSAGTDMDESTGITGWIWAGVTTIIGTLTSAVAFFYKTQIADYKARELHNEAKIRELEARADKCEDDRNTLRVQVAVHETRLSLIEKEQKRQGQA